MPLALLAGGLTAVIYTDLLQTVIMVLGAFVLMFIGKGNLHEHHTAVWGCQGHLTLAGCLTLSCVVQK